MTQADRLRLAIDIGGTFTDTVLMDGGTRVLATTKTPTTHQAPAEAALAGAEAVLAQADARYGPGRHLCPWHNAGDERPDRTARGQCGDDYE